MFVGFPGVPGWWQKNPGPTKARTADWPRHEILNIVDNESPIWGDITGDGIPELICAYQGAYGYAAIPEDPTKPWPFKAVTAVGGYQRFTHGLGIGDVNDDGRVDLLDKDGWWEHPAEKTDGTWKQHRFPFSQDGGAQMYAVDFDGDGKNEVITSLAAHGYGLVIYRKSDASGEKFERIDIMTNDAQTSPTGLAISQLHAIDIADFNQDGIPDILTGKRWWAHNGGDAGENAPAVLVWFEAQRTPSGLRFIPHPIDRNSGIGTQAVATDLNGDGAPDIVIGNKRGTFVFTQTSDASKVSPPVSELAAAADSKAISDSVGGYRPTDRDGRLLNFNFETGDLRDWDADGGALLRQPIQLEKAGQRKEKVDFKAEGKNWIGTFEIIGLKPTGTLTSRKFVLNHPWVSFLVAGGNTEETRVEIVNADTNEVVAKTTGNQSDVLSRKSFDLSKLVGQKLFVRVVDAGEGDWGYIHFDDLRLHDKAPSTN